MMHFHRLVDSLNRRFGSLDLAPKFDVKGSSVEN